MSVVVFASCSAAGEADRGEVENSTLTGVLPGESIEDAQRRMLIDCFAEFGLEVELDSSGGMTVDFNEAPEAQGVCNKRVEDSGLVQTSEMTADELAREYVKIVAFIECIRSQGFDAGRLVSEEEFIATGGALPYPDLVPMLNTMSDSEVSELMRVCPQG